MLQDPKNWQYLYHKNSEPTARYMRDWGMDGDFIPSEDPRATEAILWGAAFGDPASLEAAARLGLDVEAWKWANLAKSTPEQWQAWDAKYGTNSGVAPPAPKPDASGYLPGQAPHFTPEAGGPAAAKPAAIAKPGKGGERGMKQRERYARRRERYAQRYDKRDMERSAVKNVMGAVSPPATAGSGSPYKELAQAMGNKIMENIKKSWT
jgi:hypothetical protein